MRRISYLGFLAMWFASACTTTRTIEGPLNQKTFKDLQTRGTIRVDVRRGNETPTVSELKSVDGEVARLTQDDREWTVQTPSIKRVKTRNRVRGALTGMGIGLLSGGAIGGAMAMQAVYSEDRWDEIVYVPAGIAIGLLAVLIGGGVGAFVGHTTVHEFVAPQPVPMGIQHSPGIPLTLVARNPFTGLPIGSK